MIPDLPTLVPSNHISRIRQENRSEMVVERTAEALDVFCAQAATLIFEDAPLKRDQYREMRREHARRIVEAVIGLYRHA